MIDLHLFQGGRGSNNTPTHAIVAEKATMKLMRCTDPIHPCKKIDFSYYPVIGIQTVKGVRNAKH